MTLTEFRPDIKSCIVFLRSEYESYILLEFLYSISLKMAKRQYEKIDLFLDSSYKSFSFIRSIEIFSEVKDLIEISSSIRNEMYSEIHKIDKKSKNIRMEMIDYLNMEALEDRRYIDIKCQDTNSIFCRRQHGTKQYYVINFSEEDLENPLLRKFFFKIVNDFDSSRKPYIVISNSEYGISPNNSIEINKILSSAICYIGVDSIEAKLSIALRIPTLIHSDSIKENTILNRSELRISKIDNERIDVETIRNFARRRWAIQNCIN